jgi:hypothetical protein
MIVNDGPKAEGVREVIAVIRDLSTKIDYLEKYSSELFTRLEIISSPPVSAPPALPGDKSRNTEFGQMVNGIIDRIDVLNEKMMTCLDRVQV